MLFYGKLASPGEEGGVESGGRSFAAPLPVHVELGVPKATTPTGERGGISSLASDYRRVHRVRLINCGLVHQGSRTFPLCLQTDLYHALSQASTTR
jgi:hypothetical protein